MGTTTDARREPKLSVVVVAYDMARELPRTLQSLSTPYQRGIDATDYEIVVVDNGSPEPVVVAADAAGPTVTVIRIDDAPSSPARAANLGIARARGALIGLIVDGARLCSDGLLRDVMQASQLSDRAVISPLAWHLGAHRHMDATTVGYTQDREDALLESIQWPHAPEQLFTVATLAASSGRGYFGPMGESSALFMTAALWHELRGVDEVFAMPGGGYMNHDLYRRAANAPDTMLVTLVGQGTFHQIHGGAATSGGAASAAMRADYERIRGEPYKPPRKQALLYGAIPVTAVAHLESSVAWFSSWAASHNSA